MRRLTAVAAVACAASVSMVGGSPSSAATVPLSISVVHNHFVNGAGNTIRLLGVNHTSSEYACVDGFGYDDGHFDNADAAAIASWGANAVRIPLNEDCWLGLNGQPNGTDDAGSPLTQTGYQQAIKSYVADLNAHHIYAILDLHWTAPGTQVALEQQPMPDQDHSPAFWTSVASTFQANRAVVFDLFNEPFDPTDGRSGDDPNPADKVSWNCWETGTAAGAAGGSACFTQADDGAANPTTRYQVAGMQTLLDAVRATGAKQPVLAGGLEFANDLGEDDHGGEWMNHAPNDPLNREAASFHNYMGEGCDHASCWKHTIAPVAAHVPVVTGEFDEDNFDERTCANKKHTSFDTSYMNWADSHGVSYLAWGWIVETTQELASDGCNAFTLIDNYSHYTPARPNGVTLHHHLRALASGKPKLEAFHAALRSGGKSVGVRLGSTLTCKATLTARTVHSYKTNSGKAHPVPLGAVHAKLQADTAKTVVHKLPRAIHRLLVAKHSLKLRVRIALTRSAHHRTVIHRTVTLKLP